jgi:hypothetical protein
MYYKRGLFINYLRKLWMNLPKTGGEYELGSFVCWG